MTPVTNRDITQIGRFPGVLWKRYLRWIGLPMGANDRLDEIPERLAEYVDDGRLSLADLRAAFVEFDECGDKTVLLFKADPHALARLRANQFDKIIPNTAAATLATPTDNPKLNYTVFAPPNIRLSWTELHHVWDMSGAVPELVPQTKLVVLQADIATGHVSIAFDRPGRQHVHGARAVDYFGHYTALAAETLKTALTPIHLYGAIKSLESRVDLVLIKQIRPKGMQGRMILTPDVPCARQMAWYAATVKNDPSPREQARYAWIESPAAAQRPRACALFREVPTELIGKTGMIKFTQHTLAHEMEYILGHVRSHA